MTGRIPVSLRDQLKRVPGLRVAVQRWRGVVAPHLDRRRQRRQRPILAARALPQMVAIELTNTCNLRCAKCPLCSTTRPRGFIEDSLFEKLLRDIGSAGATTEIALSGSGEPTLHPRVVDYVKAVRNIPNVGVIGFATNGVALTPELSERLLDAGLTRLKASLDTDDAAMYQKLNGADKYEMVTENFVRFCEINKKTGGRCRVTLKATLYENDLFLGKRLIEQWSPHVDQVRVTPVHNWAGTRESRPVRSRKRLPCGALWQHVQVLWDGQITLCCLDSMEGRFNMGNASQINLSDYWQRDEGLQRVRRQHVEGDLSDLPVCATCDICGYADITL